MQAVNSTDTPQHNEHVYICTCYFLISAIFHFSNVIQPQTACRSRKGPYVSACFCEMDGQYSLSHYFQQQVPEHE